MTELTSAPSGEGEIATHLPADAPEVFNTPREAAEYFTSLQDKRKEQPAESAEPATADNELPDEGNPESPEKATTEGDKEVEPDKPAIDPPKSWTKDLHEHWNTLDPVLQERIVARDREDQAAIKRAFNEAADERKAIKAERETAEKARQSYEEKLPALLKALNDAQGASFADIRSMDDAKRMQQEDPFRFQAWQLHQMELQAVHAENEKAEQRKTLERQSKRQTYEAEQNKALVDFVPEMADPKKASELRERAVAMLTDDLGLKNDQLSRWYADDTGHEILSNAGIQKLIADGLKYRDLRNAPKAVVKADLPPVQKPGTPRPPGSIVSERLQALNRKPDLTVKEATELYELQQRSTRRAS